MNAEEEGFSEMTPGSPADWGCYKKALPDGHVGIPSPRPSTIETETTPFSIALEFNPAATLVGVAERCELYEAADGSA